MTISVLLLWTGCLGVFLSSPNQQLINNKPKRKVTWPIFTAICIISWYLILPIYPAITSGLVVLSIIMTFWTVIVIAHGHLKLQLFPFASIGALFCAGLAQLGGL